MTADADVDAQWHHRDIQGAIKFTAIINNSAQKSAWVLFVYASDILQYVHKCNELCAVCT